MITPSLPRESFLSAPLFWAALGTCLSLGCSAKIDGFVSLGREVGGSEQGGATAGSAGATDGESGFGGDLPSGGTLSIGGAATGGAASPVVTGGSATETLATGGESGIGGVSPSGGNDATGGSTFVVSLRTVDISAYSHTCARLSTGAVWCWGENYNGQLGNGTEPGFHQQDYGPVAVLGITDAVSISAGGEHTCALLMGGSVQCWGYNYNSQLGDGTTTNSPIAVTASEITNAVAISTGSTFSCALLSDGSIKCWGNNYYGQLGDGTTTNQTTPATVSNVTSAVAISSGPDFSCALLSNGSMKCWGSNYSGQLGDGTTTNRSTPVPVSNITNAVAIAAGGINWVQHSCAVLSTGAVQCWGDKGDYKPNLVPVAVPGISSATAVAVSGLTGGGTGWQIHACALLSDRTVQCWGQNESGELGNGTTLTSSVPVTVTGITTARAIAAGYGDACAVLEDNTIKCWGNNDTGQLGNGTMDSSATPVQVVGF